MTFNYLRNYGDTTKKEIRDSSIAIANAAKWFCTVTDMEQKDQYLSEKNSIKSLCKEISIAYI